MEEKYEIKPLDCIFFVGNEFVSKTILSAQKLWLGKGDWSHVGIVVNKDVMPSLRVEDNELYIWESTISSTKTYISKNPVLDAETGKEVFGVQIRKLRDVIKHDLKLGVKIGWGKLLNNPYEWDGVETFESYIFRLNKLREILDTLHAEYFHRPYSINICRLFAALFSCCSCCRGNSCVGEEWRFCSQLVAIIYKKLGVLSEKVDPEVVVPQDLATPDISEEKLPKILNDIVVIDKEI